MDTPYIMRDYTEFRRNRAILRGLKYCRSFVAASPVFRSLSSISSASKHPPANMLHRFSLVVLALFLFFASIVRAVFPACAQDCLGKNLGSCSATDNVCMCKSASFCNSTNTCFRTSCSAADWKAAYDEGVSICNAAGVTKNTIINPPPPTKREFVPVYYGRAITA